MASALLDFPFKSEDYLNLNMKQRSRVKGHPMKFLKRKDFFIKLSKNCTTTNCTTLVVHTHICTDHEYTGKAPVGEIKFIQILLSYILQL